jgi:putative aldouronate transport system permease protein
MGVIDNGVNYLMSNNHMWLKMLAWGMWKGLGWSAIIYVAAISGIDQQLYEAATVDGAGRFQRMWHITVPSLLPTFLVLLVMAVAGILSNGMDQYLVFENSYNTDTVMVLDLYVYKLGINNGKIPLATVVGMAKSIISIILLFGANKVSKMIRGNSII